jgi:uncharacterized protein (TIGR03437 family)
LKRIHLLVCLPILFLAAACIPGFGQQLTVSPTSVTLSAQSTGAEVSQRITLSSSTATGFLALLETPATWLRVTPTSGNLPTQSFIDVFANPAGLPVGTYSNALLIYAGSSPVRVPVSFSVGTLSVVPSSLSFTYQPNGAIPNTQLLTVNTASPMPFTVTPVSNSGGAWLQVAPANGTAPTSISVGVNPAIVTSLAPGIYTGTVTITPIYSTAGPAITVAASLTVTGAVQVSVSSNLLSFGYQSGGSSNLQQQTIIVSTNSANPVSFFLNAPQVDPNPAGINWLSVNPTSGVVSSTTSANVVVSILPGTLPPGAYAGRFTLTTPGAAPVTQDIVVRLTVSSNALLNIPVPSLTFNYQIGTSVPPAQTLTPTSTSSAIQYSITASTNNTGNWLVVPTLGSTPNSFQVSVNPAGLAAGNYTGSITIQGINLSTAAQTIPVYLKVSNDPVIVSTLTSISFPYQVGQSLPAVQAVRLTSSTGLALSYTVTTATPWLTLGGQTLGSTEGLFTVQANPLSLQAGTYDGSIIISATNPQTGVTVPNSPITIPVKLYVSASPLVLASPTALQFTAQVGGSTQISPQGISLNSTSQLEQVQFRTEVITDTGGTWLFAQPQVGSTPGQIVVTVVPILLSAGSYTGAIKITATTAAGAALANSPILIPVTLTMTAGTLTVSPTSLSFTQTAGGATPAAQTVTITTSGQPTAFTVGASHGSIAVVWINLSATGGTTPGSVNVSVDASRLTPGTYQGVVQVTAQGLAGSPATIPITFTVNSGTIAASPSSLTFAAAQGGAQPATQTVNVTTSVGGSLNYSVTAATNGGGNWLLVNPSSGSTPGSVSITANPAGLAAGTYTGSVTITSTGATGSPIIIPVTFTVNPPASLAVSPGSLSFAYTTGLAVPAPQNITITSGGAAASFTVSTATASGSGWLSVSPTSGNSPATISVSVNPQNLAAGTYNGTVTINSPNAANPVTISVSLNVQAIPPPTATNIVNSASFAAGPVAPGEIITIGGSGMANANDALGLALDNTGNVATKLGDTRVLFDGNPGPLWYVSPNQINCIVPYGVAGRVSTRIQVEYKGVLSTGVDLRVVDAAPAIYTQSGQGVGPGAILNQNYSLNTSNNPAVKGSAVIVYATGEGQTSPAGVTGSVIPNNGSGLKRPLLNATATVGGRPARVLYAGSAPGFVSGAFQLNIEIPADAPSGAQSIVIQVGSFASQPGVTVAVQ